MLTGSWEVEFVAGLNQADHRVAGMACLDAIRDADNRWVFPELLEEGLEPWRVRWFLVSGHTRPTHGVDVSGEPLARGVAPSRPTRSTSPLSRATRVPAR